MIYYSIIGSFRTSGRRYLLSEGRARRMNSHFQVSEHGDRSLMKLMLTCMVRGLKLFIALSRR
jgi:hypothetical protein